MLKFLITLTIFSLSLSADQKIPIAPLGFSVGSPTPKIYLEGFFNLIDPNSSKSFTNFWSALQKLDIDHNPNLRFTFYVSPEPTYYFSFMTSTGGRYISKNSQNPNDEFLYYQTIFENYETFSNAKTVDQSLNQVALTLAKLINSKMPQYKVDDIYNGLTTLSYLEEAADYGAFARSRGVVVAPTYFINEVQVDGASSFTTDRWVNYINQFLQMNAKL